MRSASAAAATYINVVDGANTTLDQIDAFNATYLHPLKAFNKVVNTIADVSCVIVCCR